MMQAAPESFEFLEASVVEVAGGSQKLTCPDRIAVLNAKESTLIPMFNRVCDSARTVLVYRRANGVKPDRAIRFTNTLGVGLPVGAITVDQEVVEGTNKSHVTLGKAILQATQPGEDRLIIYATDLNVVVRALSGKPIEETVTSASLKNGKGFVSTRRVAVSEYVIKNHGDEEVELYLEHARILPSSQATASGGDARDFESMSDGYFRTKVTVPSHADDFIVAIKEVEVSVQQMVLSESTFLTIVKNGELGSQPGIVKILDLYERMHNKAEETKQKSEELEVLKKQHQRTGSSLETLNSVDVDLLKRQPLLDEFLSLGRKINDIENIEIPKLRGEWKELESEQQAAIKALSAEWVAKPENVEDAVATG
jgi:hypothetical protein